MRGNHTVAEAAVRAGCRYYFGYPITPQTIIVERLADLVSGRDDVEYAMLESARPTRSACPPPPITTNFATSPLAIRAAPRAPTHPTITTDARTYRQVRTLGSDAPCAIAMLVSVLTAANPAAASTVKAVPAAARSGAGAGVAVTPAQPMNLPRTSRATVK